MERGRKAKKIKERREMMKDEEQFNLLRVSEHEENNMTRTAHRAARHLAISCTRSAARSMSSHRSLTRRPGLPSSVVTLLHSMCKGCCMATSSSSTGKSNRGQDQI